VSRYASETSVSTSASKAEIERIIERYGATEFMSGWSADQAVIAFTMADRQVRFILPMPSRDEKRFTHHSKGARTPEAALKEWEQACRQRWRALALWIKAVLEAAEAGIITIESALLSFTMLPNGQTVGEWSAPQLIEIYETGHMPPLLPG